MKKFFFSLAAVAHLLFAFNAYARDLVPQATASSTAQVDKEKQTRDKLTKAFLTLLAGGLLVSTIEKGGGYLEVPRTERAVADMTVILAALAYAFDNEIIKEIAKRFPIMSISAEVASSEVYLNALENMAFFGDSLKEIGRPMLASMSTVAIYNLIAHRIIEYFEKKGFEWTTGTSGNS